METLTRQEKIDKIKQFFGKAQLDPEVTNHTIGVSSSSITSETLLASSSKLVKINAGKATPDDRDHLLFSTFHGLEDFIKDHIEKDHGGIRAKAKQKIQFKKDLSWLKSGFFTPLVRSTVVSNPLAQNLEGINPMELQDVAHRVTKLGPGGITSIDQVPDVSRNVHDSSFGFIDALHQTEGLNIGVTGYLTHNVVKGKDNKLYRVMKNSKTGKTEWVSHEKLLKSKVKIPIA